MSFIYPGLGFLSEQNYKKGIKWSGLFSGSLIANYFLHNTYKNNDKLQLELVQTVRDGIGPIATPQQIYFVTKLPKTRSGKIMRRLLRSIASNDNIGDISTLEDSDAVQEVKSAFDDQQNIIRKNEN